MSFSSLFALIAPCGIIVSPKKSKQGAMRMDNPFKNLDLNRWFNVIIVLSAMSFLYALAFEVKFADNATVALGSLAVFFASLGVSNMQYKDFDCIDGNFVSFTRIRLNFASLLLFVVAGVLGYLAVV